MTFKPNSGTLSLGPASGFLSGAAAAFPLPACGERDRVRGDPKLGCEHLQHAFEIAKNLVVPDTNDAILKGIQVSISALIRRAVGVLSAIDLDDEALLAADKIDVVRPDRLLAREFHPAKPAIAKRQPQDPFGPCAPSAERAGAMS